MFRRLTICIGALGLLSSAAFAHVPNKLTLDTLLQSVRTHFPQVQAAYQQVLRANAEQLAAKGAFDPTLFANWRHTPTGTYENHYTQTTLSLPTYVNGIHLYATYLNGRGDFGPYDSDFYTNSKGEYEVGVDMPLLRNRAIDNPRTRLANSKVAYTQALQQYLQEKISIMRTAADIYWRWVADAKILSVQKHMIDLALKRQSALQQQYEHGDIAKMVVLDNQRALMQRKANLTELRLDLKNLALSLSLFYRDHNGKPIIPSWRHYPQRFPALRHPHKRSQKFLRDLSEIIMQQPQLKVLNQSILIKRNEIKLADNALLPTLDMKLYTERDWGAGPERFNRTSYTGMLNFSLPLFRREAKGELAKRQHELAQLLLQRKLLRHQLSIELWSGLNRLRYQAQRLHYLWRQVDYSRQVESAEELSFAKGNGNLFLVNQREQDTAKALTEAYLATKRYFIAKNKVYAFCQFRQSCLKKIFY